jgi:acetyltransferase-like isoleucine patch superfamily enzyme
MNKILKIPFLFKILRRIFYLYKHIVLRYAYGIKKLGSEVCFHKGFRVFNGASNIVIGRNVFLVDALLNAGDNKGFIHIEDYVFFGHRVMILARDHDHKVFFKERASAITEAPITIKSGACIGSGSIILSGVTIGENSVVAAGSVVTRDVAPESIFGGVPARFIKKINN